MGVKKLFVIEIVSLVIIVVGLLVFVEVSPFLASSKDASVAIYDQKEIAEDTLTIRTGQRATARAFVEFNYSSYDPSILVLELVFLTVDNPGNFSIYCNNNILTTINVSSEKPQVTLNVVSLSGLDWVDSPARTSISAINRIIFASDGDGYEGTFNYKLYLRGSR